MNVTFETVDGVVIAKPKGHVDSTNSKEFGKLLLDGVKDASNVKMDMTDLEYISSAGLREILLAAQEVFAKDNSLVISNLTPEIRYVFDITGFSEMFTIE